MNRNLRISIAVVLIAFAMPLAVITLQSATSDWPLFWQVRLFLVNCTGMAAMILMSLTVILSYKHPLLERCLNGLDKQYQLHKYLGIASVVCVLIHWLSFLSDDIVMELGFVPIKEERFPFWKLNEVVGEPAQLFGEWGFYISSTLALIALIKYFPHHVFQLTHTLFPYLYLLIVLHVLVFFEASLWLSFPGIVMAIIISMATTVCIQNILNLNGKKNRRRATIDSIQTFQSGLEVSLRVDTSSPAVSAIPYRPGQFAFVGFDDKEKAHPFSIASPLSAKGKLNFLIKSNGDYTNTLSQKIKVGQSVDLEGPYGCFDFQDKAEHQIWIAGGIGIAPFMAALRQAASRPSSRQKKVDLFYTYHQMDDRLLVNLKKLAEEANVSTHLNDTETMPRFDVGDIVSIANDMSKSSVWFCGPAKLGVKIENEFLRKELPASAFHREVFSFR